MRGNKYVITFYKNRCSFQRLERYLGDTLISGGTDEVFYASLDELYDATIIDKFDSSIIEEFNLKNEWNKIYDMTSPDYEAYFNKKFW
jgi:hypothetical protein